jgi:hypothetical protein
MNVSQRVTIIDSSNFNEVVHSIPDVTGKLGMVTSIHESMNGIICYVELDNYPMTLPFYETELEIVEK